MHSIFVLGTFNETLRPVVDTERNPVLCRWLTLVGFESGEALRLEGRGRRIETLVQLIEDDVEREAAAFIRANGGACIVVGV